MGWLDPNPNVMQAYLGRANRPEFSSGQFVFNPALQNFEQTHRA